MLKEDIIHRIMERDQRAKDEEDQIYRMAKEGIPFLRKIAREEGEVAAFSEFCDDCCYLKFLHDPDPYDWFEDNEMMAVCVQMKTVIEGALGTFETNKIRKPLYCPKFGRKLTEEEKEESVALLKWSQERWIKEVK